MDCKGCNNLNDDQINRIVDKTIERMTEKAYHELGRRVVNGFFRILTAIGVFTLSLYFLLKEKGFI